MDRAFLECLIRLRSPEFTPYLIYLRQRLEAAKDSCTSLSGEALMRAQGKAGELKALIDQIENVQKLIDNMKNRL